MLGATDVCSVVSQNIRASSSGTIHNPIHELVRTIKINSVGENQRTCYLARLIVWWMPTDICTRAGFYHLKPA